MLKDLAPVIAKHPRLAPLVQACHARIARAVFETCESYLPRLQAGENVAEPPVFAGFALTAQTHAAFAGVEDDAALRRLSDTLGEAGLAANRHAWLARAIALHSERIALSGGGLLWSGAFCNELADAYANRGTAKQDAEGHGATAALADSEVAITIRKALRQALEPQGKWDPPLRNDLACVYVNRGDAKLSAKGHGPTAALRDYDAAIAILEVLRQTLEPQGQWDPSLRDDLAGAYSNPGIAKLYAKGHGPVAALLDHDAAIAIQEALRQEMEPQGRWDTPLREAFAVAHVDRYGARLVAGHLRGAGRDAQTARDIFRDLIRSYGEQASPAWANSERAAQRAVMWFGRFNPVGLVISWLSRLAAALAGR